MLYINVVSVFLALLFGLAKAEDLSIRYEVKLIEKIAIDITKKDFPKVCVNGYPVNEIKEYSSNLIITNCNNADIIIAVADSIPDIKKPVIVIGYTDFKRYDNIIGSIFWRKGRPQIIFLERNLKEFDINLPQEYKKYIIKKELVDYAKADF